jgi:hypothetical protein
LRDAEAQAALLRQLNSSRQLGGDDDADIDPSERRAADKAKAQAEKVLWNNAMKRVAGEKVCVGGACVCVTLSCT